MEVGPKVRAYRPSIFSFSSWKLIHIWECQLFLLSFVSCQIFQFYLMLLDVALYIHNTLKCKQGTIAVLVILWNSFHWIFLFMNVLESTKCFQVLAIFQNNEINTFLIRIFWGKFRCSLTSGSNIVANFSVVNNFRETCSLLNNELP